RPHRGRPPPDRRGVHSAHAQRAPSPRGPLARVIRRTGRTAQRMADATRRRGARRLAAEGGAADPEPNCARRLVGCSIRRSARRSAPDSAPDSAPISRRAHLATDPAHIFLPTPPTSSGDPRHPPGLSPCPLPAGRPPPPAGATVVADPAPSRGPHVHQEATVMIEAAGLTKRYGDKLAVDDLSFAVLPGQVTGFLGPNGAGKSTTMRMILGLDAPTSGTVTVNGKPFDAA